jgi:hypothetical protein
MESAIDIIGAHAVRSGEFSSYAREVNCKTGWKYLLDLDSLGYVMSKIVLLRIFGKANGFKTTISALFDKWIVVGCDRFYPKLNSI